MSVSGVTVDEDAGSATFTVRLSKPWTSIVYVDVDTFNGTATAGNDYTAVNRRVSVSLGATTRSVSVPILDDSMHESNETFTLALSNPSDATLSASPSATSTIRDDDTAPPAAVQNLALTCTATSADPAEFRLSATWDPPVNGAVRVQAEITENPDVGWFAISASATSPYTATVTAAGSYHASVIPYLTGGVQGVLSEVFGVCAVPVVSIAVLTPVVDESGWLRYTVSMTPAAATVTVDWATTSAGSATAGTDYTARSDTVTFRAGETSKTVTVQTLTDIDSPESDETVVVELSNATVATIGTATASGTIRDVPPPVVSLTSTALSVAETSTAGVSITAVLDKPAPTAASVRVTATGGARGYGSCYAGVEFYLSSSTFSFGVGADRASIILYPCSDADYSNETINVNLTSVGIAGLTLGSPTTTVVTITDPAPPVVSITSPGTVDESAGSATFTINLSKTWSGAVFVDVATSNGSATAGSDYSSVNRRITIPVGSTSVPVPVTILDDTGVESDETFTVTLSNPTNATLDATPSAQSTIRDDDTPPPTTTLPAIGF